MMAALAGIRAARRRAPGFAWGFETAVPDRGRYDALSYESAVVRTTAQAASGAYSLQITSAAWDQVQVFNDTDEHVWGARPDRGRIRFRFRASAWTDGAMLMQLDGKSNVPALDTNDGARVSMAIIGGAQARGISCGVAWNNSANATGCDSGVLNLALDQWHHVDFRWDRAGRIHGSKTVQLVVNGVEWGFSKAAIGDALCVAYHHQSIGKDQSNAAAFFLDDYRIDDYIPRFQRPDWQAAGTAVNNATGATLTPGLPAHVAGDILFAQVMTRSAQTITTATDGWQQVAGPATVGVARVFWFWKRAASSAEPNPTFSGTNTTQLNYAQTYSVRGAIATGTPWEDAQIASASDAVPTVAAVTTAGRERLLLCMLGVYDNTVFGVAAPPPSGWRTGNDVSTTTASDGRLMALYRGTESAGVQGAVAIGTLDTAEDWASLTLAMIPA